MAKKIKIGIRPTIDGRYGGVRESLEEQVLNMARSCAAFLSENLRHSDGTVVECVIPTHCIGGNVESEAVEELFAAENVGVTITATPCWCYGSETMDMDPIRPKAVWGFNGTERPGAVYLAAVMAAHAQKGIPAFAIYGKDVQDADDTSIPADVQTKLLRFARAGIAAASMKGNAYLAMGGTSMGIAGSIVNPDFLEEYLGMRSESVDMMEILRRIETDIYDKDEYQRAANWITENCKEGVDTNCDEKKVDAATKRKEFEFSAKMAIVFRDLMVGNDKLAEMGYPEEARGHGAIAAGFQGQRHWTDFKPNGDFAETMLNSSFDWNGIREPHCVATENDYLNGISMLFGKLLTNTAQIFSDVRTYWSPEAIERVTGKQVPESAKNGMIHLINSGSTTLDGTGQQKDADGKPAMKPFWDITNEDVQNCIENTKFCPAHREYFPGGGHSTKFKTVGGMPMTMCRINYIKGIGPVLQIAEGESVEIPEDVHTILDKRTSEGWPTTWFVPNLTGQGKFKDVYSVMAAWGANHGAISYGHNGADLITLASILRIPVCMHNVSDAEIFRPAAWDSFGMDAEGSDYRACQAYGPRFN